MDEKTWIFEALKEKGIGFAMRVMSTYISGKLSKIEDIVKCSLCPNMCKFNCPTLLALGSESHSPAGRARIAYYVKNRVLDPSFDNVTSLFTCIDCGACSIWCPFEYRVSEIISPVKSMIDSKSFPKEIKDLVHSLSANKFLFKEKPDEKDREGEILFLRGCTARKFLPELVDVTIELFDKLGLRLATSGDEGCCGFHAYSLGLYDLTRKLANYNIDLLEKFKGSYAITLCPTLAYTFRVVYPKLGIKPQVKVYHVCEILPELVKGKQLRKLDINVVVHDSGHLTRDLGFKGLSELVSVIPGISVRPPVWTGREVLDVAYYCSLLPFIDVDLALRIGEMRLSELYEFGDTFVVASPDAKLLFSKLGAEVYHVVELFHESLG